MDIKFKARIYSKKEMQETMDKYKVDEIEVGMLEDWFWTADTVMRDDLKDLKEYPEINGVKTSHWATLIMRVSVVN